MKKIISWGMMLAAAFTLTNCAKEIEDPNQQPESAGIPFEIVASTVDTKTVNDGMATKWDDNDVISVFHAIAGIAEYGTNDKFEISDVDKARFTGTLSEAVEASKSYDWYVLYPYNQKITTPGEQTTGYTYIGHSKGLNQTGYDNMASLKETICPLYGVAKSVPGADTPSITMNHLSSVVAIKVTNATEEELTITKASLTAAEDIVGSYYFDITGASVVYTPSEGFVNATAVVNVTKGTALKKGESATLYLAIKPHTAKAGTTLTLSVNDYAKEPKVLESDVTFHAGKIKTLNFSYDKQNSGSEEPEVTTVTWDLSKDDTSEATEDRIAWTSDFAEMYSVRKNSSTTAANNYYPGVDNRTSTRFYKNNTFTISPKAGSTIISVEFTATSDNYATAFANSTWTNASAKVASKVVTLTPNDGTKDIVATLSGTCGFTSVVVYYTAGEGGETPNPEGPTKTLASIAVTGQTTSYTVGNTFEFDGIVTATYDDETTATVTPTSVSEPDMNTVGTQDITVSYTEGEVTAETKYTITVNEAPAGPIVATVAQFLAAADSDIVWYQLTGTISNIVNTKYGNFDLTDETGTVYVYGLKKSEDAGNQTFSDLGLKEGDIVTLIGNRDTYVNQNNGSEKDEVTNAYYVSHVAAPYLTVSSNAISVAATATYAEFTVDTNVDWTVSCSTATATKSENKVIVTFEANETAEAVVYEVIVTSELGEETVTINQAAASQEGGDEGELTPSKTPCYTLNTSDHKGKDSGYATAEDIVAGGITWNVTGNSTMQPWRIGGKSLSKTDRNVYTKTTYSSELSKIEFISGTVGITWNSLTLEYSTSSDFSNSQVIVASEVGPSKTITFDPEGGFPANCYFRFKINVTNSSTSSNKYLQLSAIKFYGYEN